MGLERELGINHGNGSCYPGDGSAPATLPKNVTSWESKGYDGYEATEGVWMLFTNNCTGLCAQYKEWLDKNYPEKG